MPASGSRSYASNSIPVVVGLVRVDQMFLMLRVSFEPLTRLDCIAVHDCLTEMAMNLAFCGDTPGDFFWSAQEECLAAQGLGDVREQGFENLSEDGIAGRFGDGAMHLVMPGSAGFFGNLRRAILVRLDCIRNRLARLGIDLACRERSDSRFKNQARLVHVTIHLLLQNARKTYAVEIKIELGFEVFDVRPFAGPAFNQVHRRQRLERFADG